MNYNATELTSIFFNAKSDYEGGVITASEYFKILNEIDEEIEHSDIEFLKSVFGK